MSLLVVAATVPPVVTTTQRDAIPAGSRAPGAMVWNSDMGQLEHNVGSDATPVWVGLGYTVITNKTASFTLSLVEAGKLVEMNVASANGVTVPPNSSVAFPIGTTIPVVQQGAGQTTFIAGAGVTLRAIPGLKLVGQYAMATAVKRATDEWYIAGNLST